MKVAFLRTLISCSLVLTLSNSAYSEEHSAINTLDVSLVSLIAAPEKYNNQYIRIKGVAYFDSKYYIEAIFLTREDRQKANGTNAVFIRFAPSVKNTDSLSGKYVLAQGTFRALDKGHLNSFSATLSEVDRVEEIKVTVK